MIILIGGEKGGTGKTTLATNLAAMRAIHGRDVLLVDTDMQGSANYWVACRDDEGIQPRVACIQKMGKGLQTELQDLASRYEDIIIDAGGRDSTELRTSMVVAQKMIVPIQASQFDIWDLDAMDKLIMQAQALNSVLEASVIINRASPNPSVNETEEAKDILSEFENLTLAVPIVRERIAYRKAARAGVAVTELKPSDLKATEEMNRFYQGVFNE